MTQLPNETIDQYVTRLKVNSEPSCDFDANEDDQIREQVIEKCASQSLRKKLLEKGGELTLKQLLLEFMRTVNDRQTRWEDSAAG